MKEHNINDIYLIRLEKEYKELTNRIEELCKLQDVKYDNERQSLINSLSVKLSIRRKQLFGSDTSSDELVTKLNKPV